VPPSHYLDDAVEWFHSIRTIADALAADKQPAETSMDFRGKKR
jgi:hypothetical protein